MAITTEQLAFNISVKNAEINAKLSDSIKKAEMLDDAMEGLQDTVSKNSKIEEEYQKALQKSAETMMQNTDHVGKISQSTNNLNKSLEQTTSIIGDLSNALSAASVTLAALKKAYDIISDPRIIEAARDMLTIFEAMAVVKGFEKLASGIDQARKKLEMLAESLDKVRSILSGNIFNTIDAAADKAQVLLTSISLVTAATKALVVSVAGLAAFSIFQTISRDGLVFGKILSDLSARFTTVFKGIGQAFSQLISNLKSGSLQDAILSASTAGTIVEAMRVVAESLNTGITGAALRASAAYLALSIAIKYVVSVFGEFIQQIGVKLSNAMDIAQTKFAKTQQIVTQFGFVVKNFGAAYGESFIGSLAEWESQIERLANTTSFSSNELRKSAKLVIAENKALGLSYQENVKFLDRAVEIASSSGLELFEVVQRLQSALVGNATAVAALGINLGSHALEHSDLNKTIQKTVGTMTEQEKKQIALYEIYKQTEPLVGSSIKQNQTIIGINLQLANSYEQIQSKLGSVNAFSMALSSTYADLVRNVSNLPDIFFDIAGTLGDLGAIFLQVVGFTVKWIFVIGTLTTIYKIFNAVLVTNIALQTKLTAVAQFLGIAFNFQAASVTTASAAISILGKALKGGILFILGNVTTAIIGASKAIGAMTLALLANPLFLKVALIVAAVSLFIKALDELNKELNYVEDTLKEFEDTFLSIKDAFSTVGRFLVTTFSTIVQIIKILILSIVELYHAAKIGFNALRKFWNPEGAKNYQKEIDASLNSLDTLAISHTKALDQIVAVWDKASGGSTAYAQTVNEASKKTDELAFRQDQMSKAAAGVDIATIRIDILGTEVEKLTNRYSLAAKEVNRLSNEILNSTEINSEALKDYQTALEEQTKAAAQLDKLRIDTLKGIADLTKDVQKQTLKLTANETDQINQEFEERRLAVLEFEKQLSRLGPVAGDSAKQIIDAYKSIEQGRKAALKALQDKQDQESNENYIKFLKEQNDLLDGIAKRNRELQMQALGDSLTERQKINEMLRFDTEELEKQIEHYRVQWGSQSAIVQGLEKQKVLLKEAAETQRQMADMQLMDWVDALGDSINNLFGKKNIDEFFGYIKSKASELSQTPIVMEVKNAATSTVSAIPSYITNGMGKVADSIGSGAKTLFNAGGVVSSALMKVGGWVGAVIDVVMNADKYLNALLSFPKMFLDIIKRLPDLVTKFIETFPEGIRKIAEALPGIILKLVDMIPDFMIAFLDALPTLVERIAEIIPEVFIKLVSMLPKFIEIMVKGAAKIIQGFIKGLIRGLGRVLSGIKMPRIQVDPQPLQKAASKFVGSASRLFKVSDVSEDVKDNLEKVTDSIKDAFKTGTNLLLNAWKWVLEKVLMPIYNFVRDAWLWAYDNIIKPIYNFIRDAWLWAYDNVIKPISSIIIKAWQWVSDNVIKPIASTVTKAFQWVIDNVITPIGQVITSAWQWVIEHVLEPMKTIGETIAKPFKEAISSLVGLFEGVGNLFKSLFNLDFDGMKKAFQDIFDKAGEGLINVFRSLINPIVDIFNGLISALNGLKIQELGWSIKAGKLGSWSGTLIPEIDLIPGELGKLSKFAQGGLVEQGAFSLSGYGSDTVPSALTPGEFVVNRRGVQTGGIEMLSALNRGQTPSSNPITVNIEVNLDAKMTMDEGYIRGTLIPRMTDELKRASLDGKFVLSSRGIR